jgi:hypothetical protein
MTLSKYGIILVTCKSTFYSASNVHFYFVLVLVKKYECIFTDACGDTFNEIL